MCSIKPVLKAEFRKQAFVVFALSFGKSDIPPNFVILLYALLVAVKRLSNLHGAKYDYSRFRANFGSEIWFPLQQKAVFDLL